jgi:hypothetical protein
MTLFEFLNAQNGYFSMDYLHLLHCIIIYF